MRCGCYDAICNSVCFCIIALNLDVCRHSSCYRIHVFIGNGYCALMGICHPHLCTDGFGIRDKVCASQQSVHIQITPGKGKVELNPVNVLGPAAVEIRSVGLLAMGTVTLHLSEIFFLCIAMYNKSISKSRLSKVFEYSILKNLHIIARHATPHSIASCCLIKGKLLITFFLFLLH